MLNSSTVTTESAAARSARRRENTSSRERAGDDDRRRGRLDAPDGSESGWLVIDKASWARSRWQRGFQGKQLRPIGAQQVGELPQHRLQPEALLERRSPGLIEPSQLFVSESGAVAATIQQSKEPTHFAFERGCRLRVHIMRPKGEQSQEA